MLDMNTLASKGPRRDPIATPSVCFVRGSIEEKTLSFGSYVEKVNKIRFGEVQVICCIKKIVVKKRLRFSNYEFRLQIQICHLLRNDSRTEA